MNLARDELIAQTNSLPLLTGTITGTLVTGADGGRVNSQDSGLTVGMFPNFLPVTDTINLQVNRVSFPQGDVRASRNGDPIAYTYQLTATSTLTGGLVTHFGKDVTLIWHYDPAALQAAGVGFPLHVYTFNEDTSNWEEVYCAPDPGRENQV
jgi:hypothetical protein